MRIYGTYKGTKDIRPEFAKEGKAGKLQLVWGEVRDDAGYVRSNMFSNPAKIYGSLKFGERYLIDFKSFEGDRIIHPTRVKKVNKNLRCNIARKLGDDYVFIKGKFKGKNFSEIGETEELKGYLLWLAENTYNEATVINALNMLEKLHDEE